MVRNRRENASRGKGNSNVQECQDADLTNQCQNAVDGCKGGRVGAIGDGDTHLPSITI